MNTIWEIQYLRGISAICVVLYHVLVVGSRIGHDGHSIHLLSAGVDVFFIISGFIMWYNRSIDTYPASFIRDRIIRVAPSYWILTTVTAFVLIFFPNFAQTSIFSLPHLVASYLFFPYPHPIQAGLIPVVQVGWSLNYEMFFYLIFSACLLANRRPNIWVAIGLFISIYLFGRLTDDIPQLYFITYLTDSIIFEFLIGMVIAEMYRRYDLSRLKWASVPVLILGICAILLLEKFHNLNRLTAMGAGASLIFISFMLFSFFKTGVNRPLRFLGEISYSLYLTHFIALSVITQIFRRYGNYLGNAEFGLFVTSSIVLCVIGAAIYYLAVEKPVTRFLKLRLGTSVHTQPAAIS